MPLFLSRLRPLIPTTHATRAFLYSTLVQTIVDSVIVGILLNSFEEKLWQTVLKRNEKSVLPVYLGLFVLAHVVQLVLAFDALVAKNTIQVLALLIFNTLFVVYAAVQVRFDLLLQTSGNQFRRLKEFDSVQINEIRELIDGSVLRILVWFIPGMISLTEVIYLSVIFQIYKEFGWSIFKRIGADRRIKRCFLWFQVYLCMLKFDYFFFIAFSLQLVFLVPTQTDAERWLTIAALPVTLLVLILGYFAVKREHKAWFYVFSGGCVLGVVYFVYKLFIISRDRDTDYKLVFKSLTTFASFSLAALLWTSVSALVCFKNFGRGLKYHMTRQALTSTSQLDLKSNQESKFDSPGLSDGGGGLEEYPLSPGAGGGGHQDSRRQQFRMSLD
ncbi:uncharacterized protein JCM6883_002294 [Sporobolomyces salmoneus]|uniref:uncharacterized protein n=1 Tax=Sporobolomyces salmoneus TaxID=183962 RepID=UPI003179B887